MLEVDAACDLPGMPEICAGHSARRSSVKQAPAFGVPHVGSRWSNERVQCIVGDGKARLPGRLSPLAERSCVDAADARQTVMVHGGLPFGLYVVPRPLHDGIAELVFHPGPPRPFEG